MNLKLLRRGVQLASLLFFVCLLALTTWPLRAPVSPQLYLRADPLSALAVALSPHRSWALLQQFWPALLLLAATAVLGRFFCGWLCPLGVCVDVADKLFTRVRKHVPHPPQWRLAPFLLAFTLGSALFGVQTFWLLDPIPLLTRTVATAGDPAWRVVYNNGAFHGYALLRELGLRVTPLEARSFSLSVLTAAVFLLILALGVLGRRYWCRNLCPLGALLALAARYSQWRRSVSDACNTCGRCSRECKLDAIPADEPHAVRQERCVQCYDCVPACPQSATTISLGAAATAPAAEADSHRRHFLAVAGAGLGLGVLGRYGPRRASNRLIRPPGALVRTAYGTRPMSEDEFRAKCLRCGQCLKACVTGGLQPAVGQAGLEGFYTPVLVPRKGWCEQSCAACGLVCPSGALVPFSVQEKPWIIIGEARIDQNRCMAWGQGDDYRQCLVCKEHCSYGAIRLVSDGIQERPVVDDHLCVGCGICENACPVQTEAAIVVYRRGPHGR